MTTVQYRPMMSSSDALIWNIERDPRLRSTVMAVWLLDRAPTAERMAANVARMVDAIPRLRQRVEEGRPRPRWVEVDLDLEHHYVETTLPGGGLPEALELAERWVAEPFDPSRPLWKLGLLSGLADGRAAAVIKVHHSIADGLGMVMMLGAFTDLEQDPAPTAPAERVVELPIRREAYSPARRLAVKVARATGGLVRSPVGSAYEACRSLASAGRLVWPHRTPHSTLMTSRSGRRAMDVRTIPVADVKAAGHLAGSRLNDVFVAIVADAVDRYHRRAGVDCRRLRVHMPVNSRTARTASVAGNEWVPARISLVVDRDSDRPGRIQLVRSQLARLRDEPSLRHVNTVSAAVQRLGRPISRWVIGGMMLGVDVLASNVPGPPFPLFLAGARVEEFYAFGPPGGAAMNITLFTYDGAAQLGITTDPAAVEDRAAFLACLDASIAELVGVPVPAAVGVAS